MVYLIQSFDSYSNKRVTENSNFTSNKADFLTNEDRNQLYNKGKISCLYLLQDGPAAELELVEPDAGPARREAVPAEHGGQVGDADARDVARAVYLGVGDLPRLGG